MRAEAAGAHVSWNAAKTRCFSPIAVNYKDYGGRGITMCQLWRDSFEEFFSHMGPRPPGKSLERKKNDGNYEPGNCFWATRTEQAQNRRRRSDRTKLTVGNVTKFVDEWAAEIGITASGLKTRLTQGLSPECAVARKPSLNHPIKAGDKFFLWTVVEYQDSMTVICQCLCGVRRTIQAQGLRDATSKSCGCTRSFSTAKLDALAVLNYQPGDQEVSFQTDGTLTAAGINRSWSAWTALTGLSKGTIKARIRMGWSAEKAVSTPAKKTNRVYKRKVQS